MKASLAISHQRIGNLLDKEMDMRSAKYLVIADGVWLTIEELTEVSNLSCFCSSGFLSDTSRHRACLHTAVSDRAR